MAVAAPPKPASAVTTYALAVVEGEVPAGRLIRQACVRHLDDLAHGAERGLTFDEDAAAKACAFFGLLKQSKGEWAGLPLTLQPWQQFIVGSLFGWMRADGTRRFRTAYCEIPRKNGKTTFAAGVALLLAFFDGEQGAEVYCAATKRDQAKICWSEAREMVLRTPAIKKHITVLVANLHATATRSKLEPLGADADSMDGLNVSGCVVDELHAHKTRAIVDVLETATGARTQPLILYITTAGYDRHSVCWEEHEYSARILEGLVEDDTFFAYIATIDAGDDWTDPAVWAKANPNLGVSVKLDDLERKVRKALELPSDQNRIQRLHLNVWTESVTRWIPTEVWDAAPARAPLTSLYGRPCFGGLDLASVSDLACFALWFPDEDEGGGDLHLWCWCPEEGLRRRAERDRVPYRVWADQGLLTPTSGNVIDYDVIREQIRALAADFEIREIAYDRWGATQLVTQLQGDGATLVPFGQGFAGMSGPCKEFERLVLGGKVRHGQDPILRWMLGNVAVQTDPAGNMKLDKAKSSEKIDGIVAAVMAIGRAAVNPSESGSVYDERGLLTLSQWDDEDDA